MSLDDDVAACAEMVAKGDPERFRAAMAAPGEARSGLLALYAFNLEVARAPWVASEALLAEIRLRWWTDAIAEAYDGAVTRRHEVVRPLAEAIEAHDLPRQLFEETIEARLFDADAAPHADDAALRAHLDRTAGHMMALASGVLVPGAADGPALRDYARGAGISALLRARPELVARGRDPLPAGFDPAALAREGRAALARARKDRASVPRAALPAFLPGAAAETRLAAFEKDGAAEVSEFRARWEMLRASLTGRW